MALCPPQTANNSNNAHQSAATAAAIAGERRVSANLPSDVVASVRHINARSAAAQEKKDNGGDGACVAPACRQCRRYYYYYYVLLGEKRWAIHNRSDDAAQRRHHFDNFVRCVHRNFPGSAKIAHRHEKDGVVTFLLVESARHVDGRGLAALEGRVNAFRFMDGNDDDALHQNGSGRVEVFPRVGDLGPYESLALSYLGRGRQRFFLRQRGQPRLFATSVLAYIVLECPDGVGDLAVLLTKASGCLTSPSGSVNYADDDGIVAAIAREVHEETYGLFSFEFVKSLLEARFRSGRIMFRPFDNYCSHVWRHSYGIVPPCRRPWRGFTNVGSDVPTPGTVMFSLRISMAECIAWGPSVCAVPGAAFDGAWRQDVKAWYANRAREAGDRAEVVDINFVPVMDHIRHELLDSAAHWTDGERQTGARLTNLEVCGPRLMGLMAGL